MILAAHQPAYLPWLGYFDRIARADLFVYLDTVQFEKNSFINRNRIKTPHGEQWLTVPVRVKGHMSSTLRDTQTDPTQPWRVKHLKSIAMNYSRATYFRRLLPRLEALLSVEESHLADLCFIQLRLWLEELGLATKVIRSSELAVSSTKSDLILELCRLLGATCYLSGTLGREYLVEKDFRDAGVDIEYHEFKHPTYPQLWGEFLPNLSVVDCWMNCGSGIRSLLGVK